MLRLKYTQAEAAWAYVFILPALVGFVVFAAFPIVFGLWLSLTKWDAFTAPEVVGLANYRRLFTLREPLWYGTTVQNTLFFVAMMPVGVAIQLLLALMVNMKLRFSTLFRSVFFLPTITSAAVVAMVWFWMYDTNFGLINWMLSWLKIPPIPWLRSRARLRVARGMAPQRVAQRRQLAGQPQQRTAHQGGQRTIVGVQPVDAFERERGHGVVTAPAARPG